MDDLTYWAEKLRQAEQELDAARRRSQLHEAAARYQHAKAQLRALEKTATPPTKRRKSARSAKNERLEGR
jgi:hypothetical protein